MLWRALVCATAVAMVVCVTEAQREVLPLPNGGFEDGLEGWQISEDEGMSTLSDEQAATGKHSLKIVDTHPKNGSDARAGYAYRRL